MFDRDFMPCAYNAALEQGKCGFNRIRRDTQAAFVTDVFIGLVIDALVLRLAIHRRGEIVEPRFVRHDHIHGLVHVSGDDLINLGLIQIARRDEVEMSAALADADYWRVFLPLVCVLGVASDVHLVDLDRSLEFVIRFFHRFADAVAEVPRCLVGDAQHSLDLIRGDALARFRNQVGHQEPFGERKMRVMEDRPDRHRELIVA